MVIRMKREAVFSKSTRTVASVTNTATVSTASSSDLGKPDKSEALTSNKLHFLKSILRWDFAAVFLFGVVLSMLAMGVFFKLNPLPKSLTQNDIDGAVMHTLLNKELPSQSAKVAASVQGAVVMSSPTSPIRKTKTSTKKAVLAQALSSKTMAQF